jgi:glycosyltransferase involved in cell wall biosynthesis
VEPADGEPDPHHCDRCLPFHTPCPYITNDESNMTIHSICVVKDEADIVAASLTSALKWCDYIYVYENGSTDGTDEIISSFASKSPGRLILYPYSSNVAFTSQLRGEVFAYYRQASEIGDWWCRLDADELYIDDPREFLSKVPEEFEQVWGSSYQFYFTDKDLEVYEHNRVHYSDIPLEDRLRYYKNNWSELRFIKHVKGTLWDRHTDWPYKLGSIYPTRIRLKHFQYRFPEQIKQRLVIRRAAFHLGIFAHENAWRVGNNLVTDGSLSHTANQASSEDDFDWRSRVVKACGLNYDNHDGDYISNDNLLPLLRYSHIRRYLNPHVIKYSMFVKRYLRAFMRLLLNSR